MPGVSRGDPSGHQGGGLRGEGDRLIEGAGAGSGVVVPGLPQGDAAGHHPGVVEGVQGLAGKNRNSRMPGFSGRFSGTVVRFDGR